MAALGLGIGSTTAIFSVIDNVLLNPFPYANSERIYGFRIVETNSTGAQDRNYFSVPEFLDYERQNRIFTDPNAACRTAECSNRFFSPHPISIPRNLLDPATA